MLDSKSVQRLTGYPEVLGALFARAIRRARHSALSIAIVQQPRVDTRLHMLFWDLADSVGSVDDHKHFVREAVEAGASDPQLLARASPPPK